VRRRYQAGDLERVLDASSSDLIFTDLPYNADYTGKTSRRLTIVNDNLGDGFSAFLATACQAMLAVNSGAIYICMSSRELHNLHAAFCQAGGHWSTYVIWAKNTFTLGRSDYQRQYEPMLYGWSEGARHYWCGDRKQGDVWFIDKPHCNKEHPTMKPVELVERAILNSSRKGDLVLDPFAGAGSTVLAAERTGRRACVVEIDPKYADVIVRRWQS
jgi:DNA modification methylase